MFGLKGRVYLQELVFHVNESGEVFEHASD
jgi:hypothetical protein